MLWMLIVVSFVCGCFGAYVASVKGRSTSEGFVFGAFLGPFGVVAEAGLPDAPLSDPAVKAEYTHRLRKLG